jgi:hypothetical protein
MKETQTELVLRYMREVGPITPIDALREFGCFRLGARIHDLKRRGYSIESRRVNQIGAWSGGRVSFAEYSLATFEGGAA